MLTVNFADVFSVIIWLNEAHSVVDSSGRASKCRNSLCSYTLKAFLSVALIFEGQLDGYKILGSNLLLLILFYFLNFKSRSFVALLCTLVLKYLMLISDI